MLIAMKQNSSILTLCGLTCEQTAADFSGCFNHQLQAGDAMLIADDIKDHPALETMNITNNNFARGNYLLGHLGLYQPETAVGSEFDQREYSEENWAIDFSGLMELANATGKSK